jgi:hypothetical protein
MFARLDYASGGHISISFPREVADQARVLVAKNRQPRPEQDSRQGMSDLDQLFTLSTDMSVDDVSETIPVISKIHADLCQNKSSRTPTLEISVTNGDSCPAAVLDNITTRKDHLS